MADDPRALRSSENEGGRPAVLRPLPPRAPVGPPHWSQQAREVLTEPGPFRLVIRLEGTNRQRLIEQLHNIALNLSRGRAGDFTLTRARGRKK